MKDVKFIFRAFIWFYNIFRNGADVNACDYAGQSSLTRAAENGSVNTIKLLVENGADVSQVISVVTHLPLSRE